MGPTAGSRRGSNLALGMVVPKVAVQHIRNVHVRVLLLRHRQQEFNNANDNFLGDHVRGACRRVSQCCSRSGRRRGSRWFGWRRLFGSCWNWWRGRRGGRLGRRRKHGHRRNCWCQRRRLRRHGTGRWSWYGWYIRIGGRTTERYCSSASGRQASIGCTSLQALKAWLTRAKPLHFAVA